MVPWQEQIRQLRFRTFRAAALVVSASRSLKLANDAIGSKRRKKFDLTISRWSGLRVSEIYDFALLPAFDGRMRLIHKTLKSLRKPMVASSLLALRVHSLLNNGPAAIVGDDKGMKIELEASCTAALSTLATSRLVLANSAPSKPTLSPIKASS